MAYIVKKLMAYYSYQIMKLKQENIMETLKVEKNNFYHGHMIKHFKIISLTS